MHETFPADWPPHCPPTDAEGAQGAFYRLVKNDPLSIKDFRSHAELGKLPKAPACLRVGLSVFRTLEDALHQQELLPFLGNRVARAELHSRHGKTKLTSGRQPTHTTWWPYREVDRASAFMLIPVPS